MNMNAYNLAEKVMSLVLTAAIKGSVGTATEKADIAVDERDQ